MFDFCRRLDSTKVNKRLFEALIKSGAFDSLNGNRAALMAGIDKARKAAGQQQSNATAGQSDMFGVVDSVVTDDIASDVKPWTEDERLAGERETLGIYLTGHPYHRYGRELKAIINDDIQNMDLATPKAGVFAGLIVAMRILNTRRGKMAFVSLDNGTARIETSFFPISSSNTPNCCRKTTSLLCREN